jgi:hypothetical protein
MTLILPNPASPEKTHNALVLAVQALQTTEGITALTGDVTASGIGSVAATAVKIPPGVTLTGTPSIGKVPTATGAAAATWQTPAGITALTGNVTASGPGSAAATLVSIPAGVVLAGTIPATSGAPSTTPASGTMAFDPATGTLYIYNGTAWKATVLV